MKPQKRILVVDDEIDIVELLMLRLKINSYLVDSALDGIEALERVEKRKPDLILLDIKMPRLNGYKVTKKLRSEDETKDIPILILTALSEYTSDVAEQCLSLGVQGVFYKPFDTTELLSKIRECLNRSKL